MPEPSLRPERVDDTPSLAVPEEIAHCCFGAKCVDLVRRKLGVVNDPSYFCAAWQCDALGRLRLRGALLGPFSLFILARRSTRPSNMGNYARIRYNPCHYRIRHSLHSWWTKSLSADAANPALSRWPKVQRKNLFSPRQYSSVQRLVPPWP